jgi:hypothetical protein
MLQSTAPPVAWLEHARMSMAAWTAPSITGNEALVDEGQQETFLPLSPGDSSMLQVVMPRVQLPQ